MIKIIFESKNGENIMTYSISLAWLFAVTYTLTSLVSLFIKIQRSIRLRKQKNLEKSLPNELRGVTDFELSSNELNQCMIERGAYEIVGSRLKVAIRKMLNIRNLRKTLVVDRLVVLIASIFLSDLGLQMTIIDFIVEQTKAKVIIGGVTALGFISAVAVVVLSGPLSPTLQLVFQILGGGLGVGALL